MASRGVRPVRLSRMYPGSQPRFDKKIEWTLEGNKRACIHATATHATRQTRKTQALVSRVPAAPRTAAAHVHEEALSSGLDRKLQLRRHRGAQ